MPLPTGGDLRPPDPGTTCREVRELPGPRHGISDELTSRVRRRHAFTSAGRAPTSPAMPMTDVPDFAGLPLAELTRLHAAQQHPPVERWNPPHCGDSEMRIARDGRWWHQGQPIDRPEMVRLFSTILRREGDGGFVLVTPVEKLSIAVDDAPFVATELRREGDGAAARLAFRLNTGEVVIAGPEHALRFADSAGEPRPYLHVRAGLEALIARPVYYELAAIALATGDDRPGVWSDGRFFPMAVA
jgi:hypothetical protein